jgi:hypothetical protein
MLPQELRLRGDAVSDERQLGGKRYLTVELGDRDGAWLCTLQLVLDAKGGQHEGELQLEGPGEQVWVGDLRVVEQAAVEERVSLRARFELDEEGWLQVALEEGDVGYEGRLTGVDGAG